MPALPKIIIGGQKQHILYFHFEIKRNWTPSLFQCNEKERSDGESLGKSEVPKQMFPCEYCNCTLHEVPADVGVLCFSHFSTICTYIYNKGINMQGIKARWSVGIFRKALSNSNQKFGKTQSVIVKCVCWFVIVVCQIKSLFNSSLFQKFQIASLSLRFYTHTKRKKTPSQLWFSMWRLIQPLNGSVGCSLAAIPLPPHPVLLPSGKTTLGACQRSHDNRDSWPSWGNGNELNSTMSQAAEALLLRQSGRPVSGIPVKMPRWKRVAHNQL